MSYDAIEDAFNYISSGPADDRSAMVHRPSGKIFLASIELDFDQAPPGAASDPDYLPLPRKQDLAPGKGMILAFFNDHAQSEVPQVKALFARSGAFRKVKDLMRRLQLLDLWQHYEQRRVDELLRQWCLDKGLSL